MTGGRRRPEDLERYSYARWVPPPLTADEAATLEALERFKQAMEFRRKLQRSFRRLGMSFAEWRVLEATYRLGRQMDEPASHLSVARELALGESSVSRLMWQLSRRGLVSHDLDGLNWSWRVLMTDDNGELMSAAYAIAARALTPET